METALADRKGVKEVRSNQAEKRLEVHYLESHVSLSQLARAIAAAEPLHGEGYVGALALKVEGLTPGNLFRAQQALAQIKGVSQPALDTRGKQPALNPQGSPLPMMLNGRQMPLFWASVYLDTRDKTRLLMLAFNNPKGEVKLTQLLVALRAAGFKAEAYVVPTKR
ncbi:MAG: hypothetical protein NZT92_13000 [Abditibacteriales bacterium]|nr:hypothetical protein [Abditibacteriales bacterium]MDW8366816.1 hypothetical protein [Abditibacteriales bacterium]